jgi:hypothetical protein
MDLEKAIKSYLALRTKIAEIEGAAKKETGKLRVLMAQLEAYIKQRADEEGITNVTTDYGTGYWTTHYSCTVANPSAFFDYVVNTAKFELLEKRASKSAVKEYIDENGSVPPGVNFGSYSAFNVRAKDNK